MAVRATFAGIVVLKTTYKGSTQSEIAAGDEVRPGLAVMDVIDPQAMQVRAKVNQAGHRAGRAGPERDEVRLDAYPELSFIGHVELIAPLRHSEQHDAQRPQLRRPRAHQGHPSASDAGPHGLGRSGESGEPDESEES